MHQIEEAHNTQHIDNKINWTGNYTICNAHDSMKNKYTITCIEIKSILVCPNRKFSIRCFASPICRRIAKCVQN